MRSEQLLAAAVGCLAIAVASGCGHPISYQIDSKYAISEPQFARTMGNLLGPPIIDGNSVATLVNGDQIFPAMLEALRGAQRTITFETFIYWSGTIGAEFAQALAERARAGVKVHVIIDAVGGSKLEHEYLEQMKRAGVEVELYQPLRWYDITSTHKLNYRTHRKLLITDGRIGFTGGVGIADEWSGDADSPEHWRDTHYRVDGPVVAQLQAAFVDNWIQATGVVLDGEGYFPQLAPVGPARAQVFKSSAEGGNESMQLMFLLSIAAASHHVRLASAYFVPDELTVRSLLEARRRGVKVQLIVPGSLIDTEMVRRASRARWGPLLAAGVEIYEYQPTMFHVKLMIVDDLWVSIGSANLDNRSFKLNDEANLNVLDRKIASEQNRVFEVDLTRSKLITYEQWQARPWREKLLERMASLLGSQM
jgi:cardiolipin synthase A/B